MRLEHGERVVHAHELRDHRQHRVRGHDSRCDRRRDGGGARNRFQQRVAIAALGDEVVTEVVWIAIPMQSRQHILQIEQVAVARREIVDLVVARSGAASTKVSWPAPP